MGGHASTVEMHVAMRAHEGERPVDIVVRGRARKAPRAPLDQWRMHRSAQCWVVPMGLVDLVLWETRTLFAATACRKVLIGRGPCGRRAVVEEGILWWASCLGIGAETMKVLRY